MKLPQVQANEELVQFYTRFIKDFETKLNPLSLVKICVTISKTFKGKTQRCSNCSPFIICEANLETDSAAALEFLQGLAEKVKNDVQAHILVLSVIAGLKLEKRQLEQAKETIEAAKVIIFVFFYFIFNYNIICI